MTTIICHIGWMKHYCGEPWIDGGHKFVAEEGQGGEMRNAQVHPSGFVFGYVDHPNVALEKCGGSEGDQFVDGVRAIFTARHPETHDRLVVGWYDNSRVFRAPQQPQWNSPISPYLPIPVRMIVRPGDAHFLPEEARQIHVPHTVRGAPGQRSVFYPEDPDREYLHPDVGQLNKLIDGLHAHSAHDLPSSEDLKGGWPKSSGADRRAQVEQAAIDAVRSHFSSAGIDRQLDNCGWDLEFESSNNRRYCVEVKGTSGEDVNATLTPNEYMHLTRARDGEFSEGLYRLAVVTNALVLPKVHLFSFTKGSLECELTKVRVGWKVLKSARIIVEE